MKQISINASIILLTTSISILNAMEGAPVGIAPVAARVILANGQFNGHPLTREQMIAELTTADMDGYNIGQLMNAIDSIDASKYSTSFVDVVKSIAGESKYRSDVIACVADIDSRHYTQAFVDLCRSYWGARGFYTIGDTMFRNEVIRALAELNVEEYPLFLEFRNHLASLVLSSGYQELSARTVSALAKNVRSNNYEAFIGFVDRCRSLLGSINEGHISGLALIPVEQQESVLHVLQGLNPRALTDINSGYYFEKIMASLAHAVPEKYLSFNQFIKTIDFTYILKNRDYAYIRVVSEIASIPHEKYTPILAELINRYGLTDDKDLEALCALSAESHHPRLLKLLEDLNIAKILGNSYASSVIDVVADTPVQNYGQIVDFKKAVFGSENAFGSRVADALRIVSRLPAQEYPRIKNIILQTIEGMDSYEFSDALAFFAGDCFRETPSAFKSIAPEVFERIIPFVASMTKNKFFPKDFYHELAKHPELAFRINQQFVDVFYAISSSVASKYEIDRLMRSLLTVNPANYNAPFAANIKALRGAFKKDEYAFGIGDAITLIGNIPSDLQQVAADVLKLRSVQESLSSHNSYLIMDELRKLHRPDQFAILYAICTKAEYFQNLNGIIEVIANTEAGKLERMHRLFEHFSITPDSASEVFQELEHVTDFDAIESILTRTNVAELGDRDKVAAIKTFANVPPNDYEQFIRFADTLMPAGDYFDRYDISYLLSKMPHLYNSHAAPFAVMLGDFEDSYKESIMRLICSIAYQMNLSDAELGALVDMVRAINIAAPRARNEYYAYFQGDLIGKIHPQLYSRIAWFLQQNQGFLRSVPFANFMRAFPPQVEILPEHFQLICRNLWRQYYTPHAVNAHPGLAFEIHNFANQMVSDESTGDTGRFNDIILRKINQENAGKRILSLGTSVALLRTTMNEMLQEDRDRKERGKTKHYSPALREEILTWAVGCTNGGSDAAALCSVVTYLNSNSELLKTWLLTFLDESERAYGRGQGSCVKGVKERVITSLRNAVPEHPLFAAAFQQAETTEMLGVKIASLNFGGRDPRARSVEEQSKLASWTKLLYNSGARSTTSVAAAQAIFNAQLEAFFSDLRTQQNKPIIDSVVENSVELFDELFWPNYFLPEMKKLEQKQAATSAQAQQETLFDQFVKEYLSTGLNSRKESAIRRSAHAYFRVNNNGQLTEEQFVHDMNQYFRK